MDLAIPRLIQRIIDQGINQKNMQVVIRTTVLMLCLSAISALFAIGNNYLSVRVGEGWRGIYARGCSGAFSLSHMATWTG